MFCEMVLKESKALEIVEVMEYKRQFCIFKELNGNKHHAYFFVHGNSQGKLMLNGKSYWLNEVARFIARKLKTIDCSITNVYTISCFGGLQHSCVVDGIHFASLHDCPDKILGYVLRDEERNEYSLAIGEEYEE